MSEEIAKELVHTVYLDLTNKECENPNCKLEFDYLVFQQEDFRKAFNRDETVLETEFYFVCSNCYALIKAGVF